MRLSFLSKRRKEILEEENCIFYQTRNSFAAVGSSSASTPERAGTKSSDNVEEEKFSFDPFPMDGANERRHETDEGGFPFHLLFAKDGIFYKKNFFTKTKPCIYPYDGGGFVHSPVGLLNSPPPATSPLFLALLLVANKDCFRKGASPSPSQFKLLPYGLFIMAACVGIEGERWVC